MGKLDFCLSHAALSSDGVMTRGLIALCSSASSTLARDPSSKTAVYSNFGEVWGRAQVAGTCLDEEDVLEGSEFIFISPKRCDPSLL